MEPKYQLDWEWDLYKSLTSATMGLKDIQEQITKEIARLNEIKPIHFKNPEKLNGKISKNGEVLEVTFIGRELSLAEDNWTWIVKEPKSKYEHTLSILKYPKLNGYATMIKNSYGQKTESEINRSNLDKMEFMVEQLQSLTDLPF
jgi:hypothetical protein